MPGDVYGNGGVSMSSFRVVTCALHCVFSVWHGKAELRNFRVVMWALAFLVPVWYYRDTMI